MSEYIIDNTTKSVRKYFSTTNLSKHFQSSNIFETENFNSRNDETFMKNEIDIDFSILKKYLKFELNDTNKKQRKNIDDMNQNNI